MSGNGSYASPLHQEHEALGWVKGGIPLYYGDAREEMDFVLANIDNQPVLSDISAKGKFRIAGPKALDFISSAFGCPTSLLPDVGQGIGASLMKDDGRIAGRIHILRSGDSEFMLLVPPSNREDCYAWLDEANCILGADAAIRDVAVLEDQTHSLAGILLAGPEASSILQELAGQNAASSIPPVHSLGLMVLDTVPALVFHSPAFDGEYFEIYCPPTRAAGLWRAIMSFAQVMPIGSRTLESIIDR